MCISISPALTHLHSDLCCFFPPCIFSHNYTAVFFFDVFMSKSGNSATLLCFVAALDESLEMLMGLYGTWWGWKKWSHYGIRKKYDCEKFVVHSRCRVYVTFLHATEWPLRGNFHARNLHSVDWHSHRCCKRTNLNLRLRRLCLSHLSLEINFLGNANSLTTFYVALRRWQINFCSFLFRHFPSPRRRQENSWELVPKELTTFATYINIWR